MKRRDDMTRVPAQRAPISAFTRLFDALWRERRAGTQGKIGAQSASQYCASRVLSWVPARVPLGQVPSLHLAGTRGIQRREFITLLGGAALATPLAAHAQQGGRMRRIGVLLPAAADDAVYQTWIGAFLQGLAL